MSGINWGKTGNTPFRIRDDDIRTLKQRWHDDFVNLALEMAQERHISKRRAMSQASCWLQRAGYRLRDGRDLYTGETK